MDVVKEAKFDSYKTAAEYIETLLTPNRGIYEVKIVSLETEEELVCSIARALAKLDAVRPARDEKRVVLDLSECALKSIKEGMICNRDNRSLKGIVLPRGLEELGDLSFSRCHRLDTVDIPIGIKKIGESVFDSCYSLKTIILPNGLKRIGKGMFRNCRCIWFNEVEIPSSIERIEDGAFENCRLLSKVKLCEGIKEIGKGAFARCLSLNEIEIPSSVERIEEGAFEDCVSLTSVTLHEGIKEIGDGAFDTCSGIFCKTGPRDKEWRPIDPSGWLDIEIPSSVIRIGKNMVTACYTAGISFKEPHKWMKTNGVFSLSRIRKDSEVSLRGFCRYAWRRLD